MEDLEKENELLKEENYQLRMELSDLRGDYLILSEMYDKLMEEKKLETTKGDENE